MRPRLAFALLLTASLGASAQQKTLPKKAEAWKWTIEQRIAARLDPAAMAERRHVHMRHSGDPDYEPPVFVIDGEANPELFLPNELMTFLIVDSDPRVPRSRERYGPFFSRFAWDPERFWTDVRSIAANYIQLQQQNARPTEDQSRQLCALRAQALAELRQKYERFDEFLYVAVAPRGTYSSADVQSASWLTWLEGGCK